MTDIRFIADPRTGERIQAPRLGVQVLSATRTHTDGEGDMPGTAIGGVIVAIRDCIGVDWDPTVEFDTVCVHRGHIVFATIEVGDVDWFAYSGGVFPRVLTDIGKALHRDAATSRDPFKHTATLLALSVAEKNR